MNDMSPRQLPLLPNLVAADINSLEKNLNGGGDLHQLLRRPCANTCVVEEEHDDDRQDQEQPDPVTPALEVCVAATELTQTAVSFGLGQTIGNVCAMAYRGTGVGESVLDKTAASVEAAGAWLVHGPRVSCMSVPAGINAGKALYRHRRAKKKLHSVTSLTGVRPSCDPRRATLAPSRIASQLRSGMP